MNRTKWLGLLCIVTLIAACSGGDSNNGFKRYTVWGKLVDLTTQAGIPNATVKIFVGTDVSSATTAEEDVDTTDYNEAGDFQISGLPDGTHRVRVTVSGYAVYEEWMTLTPASAGSDDVAYYVPVTGTSGGTNGKIELSKGCTVSVYPTLNGAPVAGGTIYATPTAATATFAPEISAVVDATGLASLAGLSQTGTYTIIAPAYDSDATPDGIYNYRTTVFTAAYGCDDSDLTIAGALTPAERGDGIALVGGSWTTYEILDLYGAADIFANDGWGINPAGSISMVFSYPVTITDGLDFFNYTNTYVLSNAGATVYNVGTEVGATSTLSAGNTLLTITPASALTGNYLYSLEGTVSAVIAGERQYTDMNTLTMDDWYGVYTTAWTTADITADNYNGSNDASQGAATVFLEFPEYVYGRAEVKSWTVGTVTSYPAGGAAEVNLNTGVIVIDEEAAARRNQNATLGCNAFALLKPCGCPASTTVCNQTTTALGTLKYVVNLAALPNMLDWVTATPQTVTVAIDATDYEGNQYVGTVTLPIQ